MIIICLPTIIIITRVFASMFEHDVRRSLAAMSHTVPIACTAVGLANARRMSKTVFVFGASSGV